ncbi:MAG TPA: DUF5666 domain-containing protein [Candidatus Limnocylindrales bacterium]|nr:DUF5666 domain-containing protein [Candidatus Limnocylindrales bacterium]
MKFHRRPIALALLAILLIAGALPLAAQSAAPATTPEPNATPGILDAPTIELVGLVTAVTPTTITVNGLVIDISTAVTTQLPVLGAAVKVEGSLDPAGVVLAREIRAVDLLGRGLQPGEIELVGPLTAMTARTLTIAGFEMDTTSAEIYAGVGLGALVKVHATLNEQGNWIVREAEAASPEDVAAFRARGSGEFEITGTLTAIGDGFIVVNGRQINTVNAEIHGVLVPGALVKVHLSLVNGAWIAREAELATGGMDDSSDDSSDRDGSDDSVGDDHSSDDSGSGSDDSGSGSDDSGSDDRGGSDSGSDESGSDDQGDADHSGSDDSGSDDSDDDSDESGDDD